MPNFNVKDLMREAGSTISTQVSRVVQVIDSIENFLCLYVFIDFYCVLKLTEEKLNLTSDKTELDSHFEALIERGEATKNLTEKIVKDTEALLVPNPGELKNFRKPNWISNNPL